MLPLKIELLLEFRIDNDTDTLVYRIPNYFCAWMLLLQLSAECEHVFEVADAADDFVILCLFRFYMLLHRRSRIIV